MTPPAACLIDVTSSVRVCSTAGIRMTATIEIATIAYPTGRVIGYERADAEGRVTRVFESAAGRDYAFGMTYHPSGALAGYTAGNNVATTVTYDPARYWVHSISAGSLQLTYGSYQTTSAMCSAWGTRVPEWARRSRTMRSTD